jgi:alkanesulfonate monooxygenase SsuD/methylene tetrahydromethanopterin reductase-like flavin-dependent oxidoreductase (luciferase family)
MSGAIATRLGVAFSGGLPPADIVACVQLAEELGYESAWVAEGHGGDQFAILGACAAVTRRIRLGTSISSVFVRSATTIGMAAATVDQLSAGRFILGLGSSHRVQVEPEHGIAFVQPTARLRDTIAIARALVRDGVVSHRGEVLTIERFDLWFAPHRPEVPIYVAALFPRLLEMAGELADGVLLTWPTSSAVARAVEHVAIGARRAGRPAGAVDVASLIPCAVADTIAAARAALRPAVGLYAGFFPRYNRLLAEAGFDDAVRAIKAAFDHGGRGAAAEVVPDALIDAVALAGTPDTCRERLAAYRRAGLALPIVSPRVSGPRARQTAMETIRACAP